MERGPVLLCVQGPLAGKGFAITAEGLRIGREPGNEVHIDDAGVSRQHARVLLHNGAVWVQDAGSRNGIFVNGERVPDHKQLKVGDQLTVGAHVFEIAPPAAAPPRLAAPAHVAPVVAPVPVPAKPARAAPERPKWKIWPFVVAFLLAVGFIACIGLFGALRDDDEEASSAAPSAPTYSLTTMLGSDAANGGAVPAPGPAQPAAPSVQQALAVVAGADGSAELAAVPDPPAGSTARQLTDLAQIAYDSGRLNDARTQYLQALKLDPACELCRVRADRIQADLALKIQQSYDAGMRAYDSMQFTQAIAAWETVLMLAPDPNDPMHVRAAESLQKAKDAAKR